MRRVYLGLRDRVISGLVIFWFLVAKVPLRRITISFGCGFRVCVSCPMLCSINGVEDNTNWNVLCTRSFQIYGIIACIEFTCFK